MRQSLRRTIHVIAKAKTEREMMPKCSPYIQCKAIMAEYIQSSPNLPEHIKIEARQHIFGILNLMPEYLGHLELIWRREQSNKSIHPK